MAGLPRQDSCTTIRNLKWSPAEKAIARKAFDLALQRELAAVIREAKQRAARIEQPSDLWELGRYLTHCRKEIDRQYDYRYSILRFLFADLIKKDRLCEEELRGLAEDKLEYIRWHAKL